MPMAPSPSPKVKLEFQGVEDLPSIHGQAKEMSSDSYKDLLSPVGPRAGFLQHLLSSLCLVEWAVECTLGWLIGDGLKLT